MNLFKLIKNLFKKSKDQENLNNIEYTTPIDNLTVISQNNNLKNTNTNNIDNYQIKQEIEQKLILNHTNTDMKTIIIENIDSDINTIWDVIKIKENTQAEHLIKAIPSDKWITMDEIRQNIKLEFNIEYKNEKSLYPYLKTLTDINLIKINNTNKKRTWKKSVVIINNLKK